jgi:hypothetical protein
MRNDSRRPAPRGSALRPPLSRLAIAAVAPLLLVGTSACYHYVEAPPSEVVPGADVRVYAHRDGSADVFRGLGGNGDVFLDGRWVEFSDGGVVLSVAGDEIREGIQTRTLRRRVVMDPERLNRVEVRTLDRFRTGAVVTGLTVGVIWFVKSTFRVDEPGTPGRPPQNGEL